MFASQTIIKSAENPHADPGLFILHGMNIATEAATSLKLYVCQAFTKVL